MSDPIDRAQELVMHEHELRQARARLPDLEPVYERDCEDCGNRIDPRRLLAYPAATRCIGCAELREARAQLFSKRGGNPQGTAARKPIFRGVV